MRPFPRDGGAEGWKKPGRLTLSPGINLAEQKIKSLALLLNPLLFWVFCGLQLNNPEPNSYSLAWNEEEVLGDFLLHTQPDGPTTHQRAEAVAVMCPDLGCAMGQGLSALWVQWLWWHSFNLH